MESVKYEEVYLKAYESVAEARAGIGAYLRFYNSERPHRPSTTELRLRCSRKEGTRYTSLR